MSESGANFGSTMQPTSDLKKPFKTAEELKNTNTDVKTSMIFGNLWDEALEWLVKSGAIISDGTTLTYQLVSSNSTTWGNYKNATFNYIAANAETPLMTETKERSKDIIIPAGSAEYTKANNVYDMAGNVEEWTTEAYSTTYRVYRGGSYSIYDSFYPASSRGYVNPYSGNDSRRLSLCTLDKVVWYPETL